MRKTYSGEYKRKAVALVLEGKFTVKQVCKELELHENTLYRWIREIEDHGQRAFPGKGSRDWISQNKLKWLEKENQKLKEELELLKKFRIFLEKKAQVRFEFIESCSKKISIKWICKVLQVSRSGYYVHFNKKITAREIEDEVLSEKILSIFQEHRGRYGSGRIKKCLEREDIRVSRRRIVRLMRKQGLYPKGFPHRYKYGKRVQKKFIRI